MFVSSNSSISTSSREDRLATSILSVNKNSVTDLKGLFVTLWISNASRCATNERFWLTKEHCKDRG